MKSEICIVGGGPAGLAAALALTQSGREVTVLDCAVPPVDKACGEGLMPDSLEALARLGVTLPAGQPALRGIRFLGDGACVESDFVNGCGRGLRRVVLHQTILTRAEQMGVRMLWGVKNVSTQVSGRRGRVTFAGGQIDTGLIVGADGVHSQVRREAGLQAAGRERRRYGFRKHYSLPPWSPYVEIYWGDGFQIYVTPVAHDQVCLALVSRDSHLRLDAALQKLPALSAKLHGCPEATSERGSITISRKLRRVHTDGYVLLGDASGSVDAVTGEGMCLAFKQAAALVRALDANDMRLYQRQHRRIAARPMQMAALMLLLDRNQTLQRKALKGLAAHPHIFNSLLAAHTRNRPLTDVVSWQLLLFGLGVLRA